MSESNGLYIMAVMYIIAGIMHFIIPKIYIKVMPDFLPNHKLLNTLSGVSEIILGIGLFFDQTKTIAIYGIIAMLIVFLLCIHFYMLTGKKAAAGIPKWILILRIPLQFGLIYWAYMYL